MRTSPSRECGVAEQDVGPLSPTGGRLRRALGELSSSVSGKTVVPLVRHRGISGLVSTLLYLFSEPLCAIFTSDAQVVALAKTIMLIEIPLELGRAVNIVMCRALQACGDIRFPITICIISAWLTALGGGILLSGPLGLGLEGIWIAMACDECLRAGLFLWRWHSRTWSRIRLAAAY